jgi:hypothetical protein
MILVESGIPIPEHARRIRRNRYPWEAMKVGDSFVARDVTRNNIATAARHQERVRGWEFVVEPEGDDFRVFRTA